MIITKIAALATGEADSSIQSIVAGVRRSRAHQRAEEQLASLRSKRNALVECFREVANSNATSVERARQMNELAAQERSLEDQIRECRRELAPMRAEFASRVEAATAAWRVSTTKVLLETVEDLTKAIAEYNRGAEAIRRAGGDAPSLLLDLGWLLSALPGMAMRDQEASAGLSNGVRDI